MTNIAIVVSDFNYDITQMMLARAEEHAEFLNAKVTEVVHVPGVFDMPLAVKNLLSRENIDGVATLGAVVEGQTDHDALVIQHAARKLMDLSLEHNKPVGMGITGPKVSRADAQRRIDSYSKRSVETVVKMAKAQK